VSLVTRDQWIDGILSAQTRCDRHCRACGVLMLSVPFFRVLCTTCRRTQKRRRRDYFKKWREATLEKRHEYESRYREANRERLREYQREYQRAYRARKKAEA
jgi:hypothetical protein